MTIDQAITQLETYADHNLDMDDTCDRETQAAIAIIIQALKTPLFANNPRPHSPKPVRKTTTPSDLKKPHHK